MAPLQRLEQIIGRRRAGSGQRARLQANYYRAYVLNDHGHIFDFVQFEANDDDDAKQKAQHFREGFDIEVWQQGRKVAELKASK